MVNKIDNPLVGVVVRELPRSRIGELFVLFEAWQEKAYANGVFARDEKSFTTTYLFDKLQAEILETKRDLSEYRRKNSDDEKRGYGLKVGDEFGDVANMAAIMLPYFIDDSEGSIDNGKIPLTRMILKLHGAMPNFRRTPITCYDGTRSHTKRELFDIFIKEIEGTVQHQIVPNRDTVEGQKLIDDIYSRNIDKALGGIERQLKTDYSDMNHFLNPCGAMINSLGVVILNSFIFMREVESLSYEWFLKHMPEKMKERDRRYGPESLEKAVQGSGATCL